MKVTLLQTDISWANPDENICQVQQLLAQSEESDLYVLPEMWSTGFATEPEGIASDEVGNAALEWMKSEAAKRHCAISGSLAIRLEDGSYRNRHYFVDGIGGSVSYYDKHHLFTSRARAIENQCYLIGCNRVGDDRYSHYAGCSVVVDAYGQTLGQCHKNVVQPLTVNLDLAELQHRRNKFRVLDDRD